MLERQYLLTCKNASDATYHSRCIHGALVVWLLIFISISLIPQIGQWWITVVVVGLVVAIAMVPMAMVLDRVQERVHKFSEFVCPLIFFGKKIGSQRRAVLLQALYGGPTSNRQPSSCPTTDKRRSATDE